MIYTIVPFVIVFLVVGFLLLVAGFIWRSKTVSQPIKVLLATLLVAGSPILFGIVLYALNQEYMGRMMFGCESRGVGTNLCSQPCGWIMLSKV